MGFHFILYTYIYKLFIYLKYYNNYIFSRCGALPSSYYIHNSFYSHIMLLNISRLNSKIITMVGQIKT